jgi:hypothetical protein
MPCGQRTAVFGWPAVAMLCVADAVVPRSYTVSLHRIASLWCWLLLLYRRSTGCDCNDGADAVVVCGAGLQVESSERLKELNSSLSRKADAPHAFWDTQPVLRIGACASGCDVGAAVLARVRVVMSLSLSLSTACELWW